MVSFSLVKKELRVGGVLVRFFCLKHSVFAYGYVLVDEVRHRSESAPFAQT